MKLAFIIPSFRGGGAERVTTVIANELSKSDDLGVTLISLSSDGPLRELAKNVPVIDLQKDRAREAFIDLRKLLKESQPDLVFSSLPQANILMYLVGKVSSKTWKVVHIMHNTYEKIVADKSLVISYLFRKSLQNAEKVVCVSKLMAEDLPSVIDISSEQVHVIYNPIDIETVREQSEEAVSEEVFDKSPVLVGCGRLEEQKGFKYFIETLPEIKQEYPDAQIVLLGDGSLKEKLKKQAKDLGVLGSVHFFGFVDNPYKYMKAADLFVLSSLWEGFGLVVVEAMVAEAQVVATDCPYGPQEILEGGKFGTLVPPKKSKALAQAITDRLESDNLKYDVQKRAKDFSIENIIPQYRKFIEDIYEGS